MLELGKRYEEGLGVSQDPSRAAALYLKAATAIPATTPIYSPPVRRGGSGRVMFLTNPHAGPGLAEAKYRLGRLYLHGRGVKPNSDRGNALIREAASQGYAPAISHVQGSPDQQ
ncbi:tetratricopeptide repeat protein [Sphingomonas sp. MMS12-HWE2-04]|uniref:tetratricopeptide repeat protein n=1 Tax=Sphingomonas sp. MMS12-HWE2-04 TaxID=3234199 RepID=UPI00385154E8